jgi:dolichol-phosphate mannosyltransferase
MKPASMVTEQESPGPELMGEVSSSCSAAPAPKLALVIPTLHEAANIRTVVDRVRCSLDPLGISYELIIVDDDSRDGTDGIVHELSAADPRVHFLGRTGKRGLGSAVRSGWALTGAEVLGVIDADLQHPPELLPRLWEAAESGSDVVLASRYVSHSVVRKWHRGRYLLSRLAISLAGPLQRPGIYVKDPMSGFFLVRRACLENVALKTEGFKLLLEILVRANIQSVAEIPFTFGPRLAGASKAHLSVGLDYLLLLGRLWRQRIGGGPLPPARQYRPSSGTGLPR